MKKSYILTLALLISSAQAFANATYAKDGCPPKPCPCPSPFQGVYLGGNIGYGMAQLQQHTNVQGTFPGVGAFQTIQSPKDSISGADGGIILGYNYVFKNNIGLGLEAVFNWMSVRTTFPLSYSVAGSPGSGYKTLALKNAFELRVPISYVISNVIAPKILLGWDNALWTENYNNYNVAGYTAFNKTRHNGFLWGAGFDVLLTNHIIGGLEYTGIAYNGTHFTDQQGFGASFNLKPIYNKFALVLKAIY